MKFIVQLLCLNSFIWATVCFAEPLNLLIGTSGRSADGIYQTFFDPKAGKFSQVVRVAKVDSPNFLALHPRKPNLYAVCRWGKTAGVVGYRLEKDGSLHEFTRKSCPDGMGCHLAVHPDGRFLITAQYGGGSVALFPLDETGLLGTPSITEHEGGSGVFLNRQETPHPHWCGFSPCGKYALVTDLGLDQVVIYLIDEDKRILSPHSFATATPGSGPRHMRFSSDGKFIHLLNELSLTVQTFSWEGLAGSAQPLYEISTLSDEIKSAETFNSSAEILVHPTGPWIYASNRGNDSVTVFKSSPSGKLDAIQVQPVRGAFPRNIALAPNGAWLLAAGQDSSTISAHQVNSATGRLTFKRGAITNSPNPSCLLFAH